MDRCKITPNARKRESEYESVGYIIMHAHTLTGAKPGDCFGGAIYAHRIMCLFKTVGFLPPTGSGGDVISHEYVRTMTVIVFKSVCTDVGAGDGSNNNGVGATFTENVSTGAADFLGHSSRPSRRVFQKRNYFFRGIRARLCCSVALRTRFSGRQTRSGR